MADQPFQPGLFESLAPVVQPGYARGATIQERFEAFHDANPSVYRTLRQMALQIRRRGIQHFGMKCLYETLRFGVAMQTSGEEWKLPNDFTSRYARLLMANEPELEGFFETRELREVVCDN